MIEKKHGSKLLHWIASWADLIDGLIGILSFGYLFSEIKYWLLYENKWYDRLEKKFDTNYQ